jgi:integrase
MIMTTPATLAQKTRSKVVARKSSRIPAYLTPEEIARLFAAIKSPRDRAIFRLAYHRGLRASELGIIQFSDYQ